MLTLQDQLAPLPLARLYPVSEELKPEGSDTLACVSHPTTPFFGIADFTVRLRLNTRSPVVGGTGGNSVNWTPACGAVPSVERSSDCRCWCEAEEREPS